MPTEAQLRANRLNAKRSTGPRTDAGKETCRRNSLKHRVTADKLLLTIEDQPAFEATRAQLILDYAPATELESMLVEELAQNWFRLQRARAWEREVLEKALNGFFPTDPFNRAMRYLAAAERAWHKTINQLRAVQKQRLSTESEPLDVISGAASHPAASSQVVQPPQATPLNPIGSVSQNNFAQSTFNTGIAEPNPLNPIGSVSPNHGRTPSTEPAPVFP
jgi:hypothetical protein